MSGTKKLSIGVTAYQARHSAKALRRLISRFGESMSLGAAFSKVNHALPDKERIDLKKPARKPAKKARHEEKAAA